VALGAEAVAGALAESANLAFAGCTVRRGSGLGVVFATGIRTQFGRIAALSHGVRRTVSPLEKETADMVRALTVIAVAMGLAFFAYGVFAGRSLWVNLVFMMGIIVANVPEGLLPTFTLSLAMGSLRMARRNVLIKSLNAVETLGAVHVICSDKTGTLTENRLAVATAADGETGAAAPEAEARCLELALVASEVHAGDAGPSGDPLDVAVAERFARGGGRPAEVMARNRRRFSFDVGKRRSAGIASDGDGLVFAVKGAWESIRPLIGHVEPAAGGASVVVDRERLDGLEAAVRRLAGRGERVIAVAYRRIAEEDAQEASQDELERGLVLKGFLGLEDPLRPEVAGAMARCREAGIRVIMVTGDHPDTAEAIARKAGMIAADAPAGSATLTGAELQRLREPALIDRLRQGVAVFARTTPEQKMKIVAALQHMHLVVAVTGDGVNDAPALKAADVGIAMGRSGTDVARETAQVILLDDNFASIVAGIEEGRTVFANIRKFTNYVLVSNGPEILPFLIYILFPVPLALTIIQILSIDLGTDIVPAMGLGQDPPDPGIMKQPPRDRTQKLMSLPLLAHSYLFLGLIEAAYSLGLFFWVLGQGGWSYGVDLAADDPLYLSATGITLSSIVLMQIGNLFGRRSRFGLGIDAAALTNPLIVVGVLLEVFFSWAILYYPPVGAVLGTGPVEVTVYLAAWLGVPLIFGLDYAQKLVARRLAAGRAAA
jgi:sodium/potassium-transporting ATPase subunit alpha